METQTAISEDASIDPVHQHWLLYNEIAERFNLIFKRPDVEPMLNRLDCLRLDATISDPNSAYGYAAVPYNEAKLQRIGHLSKQVQQFMYKGRYMKDEDSALDQDNKRIHHEMMLILYRHAKLYRKKHRPLPLALLTPGSVVEYEVWLVTKNGPKQVTIGEVTQPSLGTAIITALEPEVLPPNSAFNSLPFPKSGEQAFNTTHVTKVIKHKPGRLKFRTHSLVHDFASGDKPRSKYRSHNDHALVRTLVGQLGGSPDPDQYLNTDLLVAAVRQQCPGFKSSEYTDWASYSTVSKRKLKRFIRQNMNRFLVSRSHQEQEDREHQRQLEKEYENVYDF